MVCYCGFLVLRLHDFVVSVAMVALSGVFCCLVILLDCGFRWFCVFGDESFLIACVAALLTCLLWVCTMMHVCGLVVAWLDILGLVELHIVSCCFAWAC